MRKDLKQNAPESVATDSTEENFVSRWSRRKRLVEGAENDSTQLDNIAPQDGIQSEDVESNGKTDADMPPLESLDESSDYSPFFSPKVSETLRKAALRKLFSSARFNIVDGLDDYDEDFRSFQALGDILTAEMRELAERRARRNNEVDGEDITTKDEESLTNPEGEPIEQHGQSDVADSQHVDESELNDPDDPDESLEKS